MSDPHVSLEQSTDPTAGREIVVTRLINAPRELVFDAWTTPEHVAQWWGPDGFTTTTHEMEVRPGGHWRLIMHGPDGTDYNNHIVFERSRETGADRVQTRPRTRNRACQLPDDGHVCRLGEQDAADDARVVRHCCGAGCGAGKVRRVGRRATDGGAPRCLCRGVRKDQRSGIRGRGNGTSRLVRAT